MSPLIAEHEEKARPWLPANAVTDGALARRIGALAQDWAAPWLCDAEIEASANLAAIRSARFDADALAWRSSCARAFFLIPKAGAIALGGKLLGLAKAKQTLRPLDHRFLENLATAALDHFGRAVSGLAGVECVRIQHSGRQSFKKAVGFNIAVAPSVKLELFFEHDLAIEMRRALLAPVSPAPLPQKLAAAVSCSTIDIGAYVGSSTIPMTELNALGIGDVIVTDTLCASPFLITIDGKTRPHLACAFHQGPSGPELHFQ